jgi:hypothetical protein
MLSIEHQGPHPTSAQLHLWFAWAGITSAAVVVTRAPVDARKRLLRGLLIALATADVFFTVYFAQPTMYDNDRARGIWDRVAAEHNPTLDLTARGLQRADLAPAWLTAEGVPHDKNVSLKIATFRNYVALTNRYYTDLAQRPILNAMATGPNRVWFSSQAIAVRPSDEAYAAFVARSESLHGGVLVVHPRDLMTGGFAPSDGDTIGDILRLPAAIPLDVKLNVYRPEELRFEVTCPERGWLLVTDRWSRAWQATVNGKPAEVWGANFIFRGVPVEAGRNDVRFTYNAVGFPYLVILSWSTAFATVAFGLIIRLDPQRRSRRWTG